MKSHTRSNQAITDADECDQIYLVRELCEAHLAKDPDDCWILEVYSRTLCSMALYAEAESAINRAEKHVSEKLMKWIVSRKGSIRECQGKFDQAETLFLEAHQLDPQEATFLIFAGSCAFRQGEIIRAEEFARQATQCERGAIEEAFYNLGGYLSCQKRYQEALDCYERALEIDPEYKIAAERLEDIRKVIGGKNTG